MSGARDTKDRGLPRGRRQTDDERQQEQIEYLLFQSTRGVHFMFDNADIAKVLSQPADEALFFTDENMDKVQGLLSRFLSCPSMQEKRSFLESLPVDEFELLIRSYFHLVENTILAHSTIRH